MNLILVNLFALMTSCFGYRILIINTVPTKSHFILTNGIAEALLDGGHEVTLVTSNPSPKARKSLRQIDATETRRVASTLRQCELSLNKALDDADHDINFSLLLEVNRNVGQIMVSIPVVRKIITEEQFDAVVTDWFYSDPSDAGYAAVQQVPWILLSGPVLEPYLATMVDPAQPLPIAPVMYHHTKEPMGFWRRVLNTLWQVRIHYQLYRWNQVAEQDYERNFGPIAQARGIRLPPYSEVKTNISVVFVNEYSPASQVKSLPPNMIQIGGYHISKNPPPMPKDLEEIMNSSKRGVILFSLGSWYHSTFLSNQTISDLIEFFGRLPYTVLWKYIDKLENVPKNLHIRSWLPQQSILAHPNLKVFITHSGQLSTLECMRYGVPIVSVPTFGDQYNNALRSEQAGTGVKVDLTENLVNDLEVALNKILADDSYAKRAKFYSTIFNNRPVQPAQLILHHVEQAIRTKGAYHLRSKADVYTWYQLWMLDQLVFFLAVLYALYRSIKIVSRRMFKQEISSRKVKQN